METTAAPTSDVSPHPDPVEGSAHFPGVALCFLLSGFAALLYQTAWMRQFSIAFGTSELAVATVLAAYMAGLAVGAALAGRWVGRVRRPVLAYGLLELGIAVSALLVPTALGLAADLRVSLLGGQPELPTGGALGHSLFYLICAFVILMVPTAFMGATLPLLTRQVVRRREQIGRRVGGLYAINTLGAVFGTVIAAFYLLPLLGLKGTVWVGVAVNAAVFGIAAAIARGADVAAPSETAQPITDSSESESDARIGRVASWILPLMLVSGATSFVYEVLWTRMLSHLLGGSVYAFATMLAAFLTGITIGSAVAAQMARTRRAAAAGFAVAQLATAGLSILIYAVLDGIPSWEIMQSTGERESLGSNALIAAAVMLPATLSIGATFPFALRVLARDEREAGAATGRVYAWNTFGAILGAVLAGFFVIPGLGFEGTVHLAVAVNTALALAGCALWLRSNPVLVLTSAAALLGVLFAYHPSAPENLLISSPFPGLRGESRLVYSGVGRSASVSVVDIEGQHQFRCNGLPEGGLTLAGTPPFGMNTAKWLALLPVLARPRATSMLVVGLGAGAGLEDIPPSIETIDVIELEPVVIEANRAIASLRERDPLADPRMNIIENDARTVLALSDERYDVIASQPSHPWTAGASHLYTREFMQQARERLTDDGVFVLWIHAEFLDEELLRSLTATFVDTFEHTRLYRPFWGMLVFMGSGAALEVEQQFLSSGEPLASAPQYYARHGIFGVNDLVAYLALDEAGMDALAADAELNTDDRNLLATRSSRVRKDALQAQTLWNLLAPLDPVVGTDRPLGQALAGELDPVYLIFRLIDMDLGFRASAGAMALERETPREMSDLYIVDALAAGRGGTYQQSHERFLEAVRYDQTNERARFALVHGFLSKPTPDGNNTADVLEVAQGLTGARRAVVDGWAHYRKGEWQALAALEAALASAEPTDLCYPDAIMLRAAWRSRLVTPDQKRNAAEALRLIDTAVVVHPDPLLYLERISAAGPADRPDVVIETANAAATFLAERAAILPAHVRDQVRASLAVLRPSLAALALDPRVSPARVAQVTARLNLVLGAPVGGSPGPVPAAR